MPFTVTVLFSNVADAKYNEEYYKSHHMPLVLEKWAKYGMKSFVITKFVAGVGGEQPVYSFGATVDWETEEAAREAFAGPEVGEIMADVPNFSNKPPVFLLGAPAGSG
ncbi:hypothetical protein C7974DRAFT_473764 [Boeremia exigua]|uniref:uncharacterized protein n=1 Tax=Boeremia exigua TaxID=749465 RepID=UPI001E8CA9D7|nr:uncharacterized protein C7974DRAFT_473764 [Boeremia exigua]KAH6619897.1 hypothetical protein C7974DRAFT_473764 [Boeremia exigua]